MIIDLMADGTVPKNRMPPKILQHDSCIMQGRNAR